MCCCVCFFLKLNRIHALSAFVAAFIPISEQISLQTVLCKDKYHDISMDLIMQILFSNTVME